MGAPVATRQLAGTVYVTCVRCTCAVRCTVAVSDSPNYEIYLNLGIAIPDLNFQSRDSGLSNSQSRDPGIPSGLA